MNGLVQFNPWKELDVLSNRLANIFGRQTAKCDSECGERVAAASWAPLVDIAEDDKQYLIKLELPEVDKKDLNVTVENGVLTVSGERKAETEDKSLKYHRVERVYGSFSRSFTVPQDTDASKVTAEFKDGVLRVQLAKSEQARPKSIEVKVS